MDYFEGIVAEYLSADRALFVNPAYCIRLNPGDSLKSSGHHWYCDIVALSFRESAIFLCEVSYSKTLAALFKRLGDWSAHWPAVCAALARDSAIPSSWSVRPWLFVPAEQRGLLSRTLADGLLHVDASHQMPQPLITSLESVTPWNYKSRHQVPELRSASVNMSAGYQASGSSRGHAEVEAEAIWQAMTALGGERSIQEVTDWIESRYPLRWKDVGTPMADLTFPGNNSSSYPLERRFLERTGPGRYRIRQGGTFTIGA